MQTRLPTEERQAGIVAAALRLCTDRSPALITTSDIAVAVGLSQGAVFKHFATKDAIWLAAMESVRDQLMALLKQAATGAATPLAGLQAVFDAHVGFVAAHPGVPRLIFHELQKPADSPVKQAVRTLMQAYRKLLTGLLATAAAHGQVPAGLDAEAAVTLFIGTVQGLVMQSMLSGKPVIARAQAERVYAIFFRGICEAP
jgi:TetR/AcrR family transcriptional regulator